MSPQCGYKLVLRESILLLLVLNIGSELAMVRIGGRVLGGSPHVHETEEEQEVIETPHAFVHAAAQPSPTPLQPLEPPRVRDVLVVHQVAEHNQGNRGNQVVKRLLEPPVGAHFFDALRQRDVLRFRGVSRGREHLENRRKLVGAELEQGDARDGRIVVELAEKMEEARGEPAVGAEKRVAEMTQTVQRVLHRRLAQNRPVRQRNRKE